MSQSQQPTTVIPFVPITCNVAAMGLPADGCRLVATVEQSGPLRYVLGNGVYSHEVKRSYDAYSVAGVVTLMAPPSSKIINAAGQTCTFGLVLYSSNTVAQSGSKRVISDTGSTADFIWGLADAQPGTVMPSPYAYEAELLAHITDPTDAHAASAISNITRSFTAAQRPTSVPNYVGQIGLETDTNLLYRATALTAGAWTRANVGIIPVTVTAAPTGGTMTIPDGWVAVRNATNASFTLNRNGNTSAPLLAGKTRLYAPPA